MSRQLEHYRRKRDFSSTPEPRGDAAKGAGSRFVVQKHDARRLHYDFRLEMDGVLKSWAVTRGPSLYPGDKRLAVHVEDHPTAYADFEGTIPKGEYGGGTVIVWDRGTWQPIGDPHRLYRKGHLEFELDGEKLKGRWHLVRMQGKPEEKRENWLLIKGEDAFARDRGDADILEQQPRSVKTGRSIAEVEAEKPSWSSRTGPLPKKTGKPAGAESADIPDARRGPMPGFIAPMLATLVGGPPDGPQWLHEIKFDGYRIQAHVAGDKAALYSRGGLDWTEKFGEPLRKSLLGLKAEQFILDGELVVETPSGSPDFSALQADLSEGRSDRFIFYAFDILYLDGNDLTGLALERRKALLQALLPARKTQIRFSEHFDEGGATVLRHACGLGLEGIVSKLRNAPYDSGRSKDWRKAKCTGRQEFVIGGFVPSTAMSDAVGSLVLGYFDKGGLVPVGRVGTGFSAKMARTLHSKLDALQQKKSPFAVPLPPLEARNVRFVMPELVADIAFHAWTADKRLRHAAFRGLREDKPAEAVTGEGMKNVPAKAAAAANAVPRRESAVTLTHPDRIYWPDEGITKQGLADYYAEMWPYVESYIAGRPLALLRCPTGIGGEHFFQKHAWKGLNEHIVRVADPQEDEEPLVSIKNLDGLIGLVQAASLEIHPWGATTRDWEHPDTLTMDLDPGENVAWEQVIEGAREIRHRLEAAGLTAFVKTSGGKGLHVVAPLKPKADWEALKSFTKAMADAMAADTPSRYVATIAKAKRRGKILIDYLRNQRGMTAIAAYSPRARPGAAISMPLGWDELTPEIGPAHFTILNAPARMAALARDPWAEFRAAARPLPRSN